MGVSGAAYGSNLDFMKPQPAFPRVEQALHPFHWAALAAGVAVGGTDVLIGTKLFTHLLIPPWVTAHVN